MKKTVKVNGGRDYLIKKEEWVSESCIQGNDELVLKSPVMNKAFQRILEDYKPTKDIAFVSLCTSSRPYSTSRKWKEFIRRYSNKADLIVCSNGGIIPLQYEDCYPFLTYDAHGQSKFDKLYVFITAKRLEIFFKRFKYKRIVFNFRPGLRNRKCAEYIKKQFPNIEIFILPTEKTYEKVREGGFSVSGRYFPDLDPLVLKELDKAVNK